MTYGTIVKKYLKRQNYKKIKIKICFFFFSTPDIPFCLHFPPPQAKHGREKTIARETDPRVERDSSSGRKEERDQQTTLPFLTELISRKDLVGKKCSVLYLSLFPNTPREESPPKVGHTCPGEPTIWSDPKRSCPEGPRERENGRKATCCMWPLNSIQVRVGGGGS